MKPHQIYGEQRLVNWTRIDMLIALYDKCISHIKTATDSTPDGPAARQAVLQAVNITIHLRSGIDHARGNLSQQIDRLLTCAESLLLEGTADGLLVANNLLTTLRDAFAQVRDEAAELEAAGAIPPLEEARQFVRAY